MLFSIEGIPVAMFFFFFFFFVLIGLGWVACKRGLHPLLFIYFFCFLSCPFFFFFFFLFSGGGHPRGTEMRDIFSRDAGAGQTRSVHLFCGKFQLDWSRSFGKTGWRESRDRLLSRILPHEVSDRFLEFYMSFLPLAEWVDILLALGACQRSCGPLCGYLQTDAGKGAGAGARTGTSSGAGAAGAGEGLGAGTAADAGVGEGAGAGTIAAPAAGAGDGTRAAAAAAGAGAGAAGARAGAAGAAGAGVAVRGAGLVQPGDVFLCQSAQGKRKLHNRFFVWGSLPAKGERVVGLATQSLGLPWSSYRDVAAAFANEAIRNPIRYISPQSLRFFFEARHLSAGSALIRQFNHGPSTHDNMYAITASRAVGFSDSQSNRDHDASSLWQHAVDLYIARCHACQRPAVLELLAVGVHQCFRCLVTQHPRVSHAQFDACFGAGTRSHTQPASTVLPRVASAASHSYRDLARECFREVEPSHEMRHDQVCFCAIRFPVSPLADFLALLLSSLHVSPLLLLLSFFICSFCVVLLLVCARWVYILSWFRGDG